MKKRTLLTSILTIVMCLSLCVGATFALFTSKSEVNLAVTSANVNVRATASELETDIYSGSATKNGNEISVQRMLPGDSFSFDIVVENLSDVAVQYRTIISNTDGGLFEALRITMDDGANKRVYNGGYVYEDWAMLSAGDANAETAEHVKTINVLVEFPETGADQNEYQNKSCTMKVLVEAVQGNATVVNPVTKISDRHYQINDAKGMMLVNGILSGVASGEGVTCKLEITDNIDMTGYAWTPISKMWVDVEGNGYTISNLNCGYDDWGRSGFYGYLGGSTVSNLVLENVTSEGTQAGIIAGALEGKVKNVIIKGNNTVTYNREINPAETYGGVGAVAGVAQTHMPENVVIEGNVTVNYNGLVTLAKLNNGLAQILDVSSAVTGAENVTEVGTATRGYIVSNDQELAAIINSINAGSYKNEEITIILKAGEYTGNYHLRQYILSDGSNIVDVNSNQAYVKFVGENGTIFKGYIKITGYGNGQGTYGGYVGNTTFENIAFDGSALTPASNGDKYNIECGKAADNVIFKNCSFANTTHIVLGGSGTNGTGDFTFDNCTFENAGCISGGVMTLTINKCQYNGSKNGFVSVQRGGNGAGFVYVTQSNIINVEEYAFRTNALATIDVKDSTIKVLYNEAEAKGSLVFFRGKESSATFTNCVLDYDTVVSYKNDGVNAETTSITIDGKSVASLVIDGDFYRVYDINGLLEVRNLIAANDKGSFGNLQYMEGKTISIERDINARGKVWACVTMNDSHGETDGFIFDGNGHTIKNLVINGAAMFRKHSSNGVADPTVFKNITFDNVVNDGNEYFSAVIWAEMYGEIELNNVKIVNSNISGACNVAAFIGRNGATHKGSEIKFVNCEVKDTIITANAVESDDNAGASYFLGNALSGGNTTVVLTFEGENKYSNVTLNNNEFVVGGGVYTTADYTNSYLWENPVVVNDFANYDNTVYTFADFASMVKAQTNGEYVGNGQVVFLKDSARNHYNNATAQYFLGAETVNIVNPIQNVTVKNVKFVFVDDDTTNNYVSGEIQVFTETMTFENCTFVNVSVSPWGVANNDIATSATITNCKFIDLVGRYGIHQNRAENLTVEGCAFINCERGIHTNSSNVQSIVVKNNTFTGIGAGYGALCLADANASAIASASIEVTGNNLEGQVFIRHLCGLTADKLNAILDGNVYGTAYVAGTEPNA